MSDKDRIPTGNKYNIDSFKRLHNVVTSENFEDLIIDFSMHLKLYINTIEKYRERYPEETKGKSNWEIAQYVFIWTDDGEHELKETIVTDADTGRVERQKIEEE